MQTIEETEEDTEVSIGQVTPPMVMEDDDGATK